MTSRWSSDAYWPAASRASSRARSRRDVRGPGRTEAKVLSRLHDLGVATAHTAVRGRRRRSPPRASFSHSAVDREHDVVHVTGPGTLLAAMAACSRGGPSRSSGPATCPPRPQPPANRWLYATTAHVITVSHAIRTITSTAASSPRAGRRRCPRVETTIPSDLEAGAFGSRTGSSRESVSSCSGRLRVNKGTASS